MARTRRTKQPIRTLVAAALFLALNSCSYQYRLLAAFIDGRLVIVAEKDAPRAVCPEITISDATGETVWSFEPSAAMIARPDACPDWLPLRYGDTPAGSEIVVQARRLRTGTVYVLDGYAGDTVEAAFRFHQRGDRISVENLDLGSNEAIAARTAAQQRSKRDHRRGFESNMRPRNEVVEEPYSDRPLPAERD